MSFLLLLIGLTLSAPAGAQEVLPPNWSGRGDAHYARRAEAARGAICDSREIDAAISGYRRALAESSGQAEVVWRLERALHFKGAFCGLDAEASRALFDEARRLGQEALARLLGPLAALSPEARRRALQELPGAGELHFWTAACWGQWALLAGKLTSARQGVASKVRDLAQAVIAIDPSLEEGGGYRLLGRLHDQAPKIPFLTGWVSRQQAIANLERSYAIAPQNAVTRVFLAEALLDHAKERRQEARALLRETVETPPRPEFLVEERLYIEQARARLAGLR